MLSLIASRSGLLGRRPPDPMPATFAAEPAATPASVTKAAASCCTWLAEASSTPTHEAQDGANTWYSSGAHSPLNMHRMSGTQTEASTPLPIAVSRASEDGPRSRRFFLGADLHMQIVRAHMRAHRRTRANQHTHTHTLAAETHTHTHTRTHLLQRPTHTHTRAHTHVHTHKRTSARLSCKFSATFQTSCLLPRWLSPASSPDCAASNAPARHGKHTWASPQQMRSAMCATEETTRVCSLHVSSCHKLPVSEQCHETAHRNA